jgi:hypothetical protein
MKCNLINVSGQVGAPGRLFIFAGLLLLAGVALFSRPMAGAASASEHEHNPTNLAVYIQWQTNRVRLHYPVAANKTYVLQYLALSSTNNRGSNLLSAPWLILPGTQAPKLLAPFDWAMNDFSVTNRNPTNLGRIYRLKVT